LDLTTKVRQKSSQIQSKLHLKALKLPDVQQRLAALGADPLGGGAAEFGAYIKSEIAKYTKVVVDGKLQQQ
jgi:tripartite-type tricarboxylate transporter receptor subunit TctC